MLSLNAAFTQRWLAWEVICLKFVVDGYSIKENKFNETVVGYDLRKRLIALMIKVNCFCFELNSRFKLMEFRLLFSMRFVRIN